jgi:hypothetical protein
VGTEDTTFPIPGLSAALTDTNPTNGEEVLSVVIAGVPEDTRFSAGALNAQGSWVFPVEALPTLQITPPEHYSGTMDLTLQAFTFESSNGDEAVVMAPFEVQVDPVADSLLIVPEEVDINQLPSDPVGLNLNLRTVDQRGTNEPGERAPEYTQFIFENVPEGVRFVPTLGGRLIDEGGGRFVFIGTVEQTEKLHLVTGSGTVGVVRNDVAITAVTMDGDSMLDPPVIDSFPLRIRRDDTRSLNAQAPDNSDTELVGDTGNDVLVGLGGNDLLIGGVGSDLLVGGPGTDVLTGGPGADIFQWSGVDGLDTITDFNVGEDILDLSPLFVASGIPYDPQVFDVNADLELTDTVDGAVLSFRSTPLVVLREVTSSLEEMFQQGSLLV